SKLQPLSRLIFGLGIRHVGEKAAYVLAQKFCTIDNLMHAQKEDLDALYEVGDVMADSIKTFFKQQSTRQLIAKLKQAGLRCKEENIVHKKSALTGKTVVFTGELKHFTRMQAEAIVREHGGNPASSVSKLTHFLVIGENPGSKYAKAKALGVPIITEQEFREMVS
ncbi:MAG: NAD-dependent DNA ligase LigA, partial [Candidatus Omnitrophica bacterium]|nr:NAD-dependent DNA ligase LigA [Candidatus Omnitrophota bacterium]